MPRRLRPTAPFAGDALLVGDPGRALLLAQALLEKPKMSNHARGLWGYVGRTPSGMQLSIQSTGMGGPSAAVVLTDLAELGVRRAIRIGTATAAREGGAVPGDLIVVAGARAEGGSASSLGVTRGEETLPDRELTAGLEKELGSGAHLATVASFDHIAAAPKPGRGIAATDMQTATVLARGQALGIATAAVLIIDNDATGEELIEAEHLERAATLAGRAASLTLSP